MLAKLSDVTKRYALPIFFILTYMFSWSFSVWYAIDPENVPLQLPILPWGPLLAALIVVTLSGGVAGLKEWASRIVRWRVGFRWYLIALLLPAGLAVAAAALNVLLGASNLTFDHLGPDLVLHVLVVLIIIALGEEPGFRGFALPRLLEGRSALSATLILAVFGIIWHVPLFLVGDSPWSNIPIIIAGYIFFTWLLNNTRGSVLIAMLLHTSVGVSGPTIFVPMFSGDDLTRYFWLMTLVYTVAGIVVVALTGPNLTRRPVQPDIELEVVTGA